MAAVLGLPDDAVEDVCAGVAGGTCVPANLNAPGQVVISGDVGGVEEGMERALQAGARRAVRLNVSGAFHSPLMDPASRGLREKLDRLGFRDPSFPVYANVSAAAVEEGPRARDLLVQQLTSPVRWSASVEAMVRDGADAFLELGPGNVLSGLNRRIARRIPCLALGSSNDLDDIEGAR